MEQNAKLRLQEKKRQVEKASKVIDKPVFKQVSITEYLETRNKSKKGKVTQTPDGLKHRRSHSNGPPCKASESENESEQGSTKSNEDKKAGKIKLL